MSHKIFAFLLLFLFPGLSIAQLLQNKHSFTHADSLRGFLSQNRLSYHVRFYDLSITINPDKQFIEGSNKITLKALKPLNRIQLDLFKNMKILSIQYGSKTLRFTRDENTFYVYFDKPLIKDSTYTFEVNYSGNPQIAKNPPWDGGFTWTKDSSGKNWVGVSCQGTGASLWWPNKDHQSDEVDSMIIRVAVPNGLKDISNGRLINTVDLGNGYTRFDWFIHNPINNYGVTVNVGNYIQFSENFQDLSCDYFVLPEHEAQARKQFKQVRSMLNAFIYYFGPYPFKEDGYKLIESPYLGMEHQSAIAYGNHFKNGYLGEDMSETGFGLSWDYIIVHESAHEWFGNNITSKDIADMWVHESFATYAEGLFVEFNQGYAAGQAYLFGLRSGIHNNGPIIGPFQVNKEGSEDMYPKGANLLNTIRHIINKDSLWFAILRKLNSTFYHKTVEGKEIENFISTQSHIDLSPVFYQYLNTIEIPHLKMKWENDHSLSFKWDHCIKGFNMPVDIILSETKKLRIYPEASKWSSIALSQSDFPKPEADNHGFYIDIASIPGN